MLRLSLPVGEIKFYEDYITQTLYKLPYGIFEVKVQAPEKFYKPILKIKGKFNKGILLYHY
jgi:hypothetical protein